MTEGFNERAVFIIARVENAEFSSGSTEPIVPHTTKEERGIAGLMDAKPRRT